MSKVKSNLASLILKEHFGEIVKKTGSHLIQNGRKTLKELVKVAGFDKEEVSNSMNNPLSSFFIAYF